MHRYLSDALFGRRVPASSEDAAEGDKGKEVQLPERIDELGFGWYQVQVWILCSGFIIAEGAEVQMCSGLVSAMTEEFGVTTHLGKAMLMTWTFIGLALGTVASGPLGDSLGRRNPLLVGYSGVILTAGFTTLASNLNMLYAFRLILGFFAGIGIPTACICISEVTPAVLRGRATAALGIAYVLGELWAAFGLCIFMPDLMHGSWRMLIAWAMLPAVSLFIFGMLSPVTSYDTPFFLGSRGKTSELRHVLNMIAHMNGNPDLVLTENDTIVCHVPETISTTAMLPRLLQPPLISNVLVMCYLMFAKDFALYGSDVFWPHVWATVDGLAFMNPAQELVATAIMGIPGVLLAIFLMNTLPRKVGICLCTSICSVCVLYLRGLQNGKGTAFVAVAVYKFFFPTWQMTTMLLPSELFGTQVRASGYSCAAAFGRFATIASPFAVELGTDAFTGSLSVLLLGAAMLVQVLPETKDCDLSDDVINQTPSRRNLSGGVAHEDEVWPGALSTYGAATGKV